LYRLLTLGFDFIFQEADEASPNMIIWPAVPTVLMSSREIGNVFGEFWLKF
jgi:hypothetical protein